LSKILIVWYNASRWDLCLRLRLQVTTSRIAKKPEYRRLRFPVECFLANLKKKILGARYWRALMPQIKYNPKSIQGVVDKTILCMILLDDNRNRNVAYFYWNDKSQRWVLNFNWVDNNFNRNDRFLVPRYYLLTPPSVGGVSFTCCFSQPPSILPASTNGVEIVTNCLLSKAFNSQANCIKYFRVSSLMLDFCIKADLYSFAVKPAVSMSSITSVNNMLIFSAKEYFTNFGRCGRQPCQSLYASVIFCSTGKLMEFPLGGGWNY
jgi:hypothetical protein